MKNHRSKRILCLLLVVALLTGFAVPAGAAGATQPRQTADSGLPFTQVDNSSVADPLRPEAAEPPEDEPEYADTDIVRVSIILDQASTIGAGYQAEAIASNTDAMAYRQKLQSAQNEVAASIEKATGTELDVVWNLTLAANLISANVPYGQIASIEALEGVSMVVIEPQYTPDVVDREETADPNMSTSTTQIGSAAAWAAGYTGAGSQIAVIDTGADTDHQSFSPAGLQYSLNYQAGLHKMSLEDYIASLDLLDAEEIAALADQLNADVDPEQAYQNIKIPFGYNYIDQDYDITHDSDKQGSHGSHVSGIATANAYIPNGDGTFSRALDTALVQGVAPDAQLLPMKVFGKAGGAYASDYMAAIEDAVILGADAINLSLGSGAPGTSSVGTAQYQKIMDNLEKSGVIVTMSAGNSGSWVENARNSGYLYADYANMHTNGAPGSYTNSLAVASVDNSGATGYYFAIDQLYVIYNEYTPATFGMNEFNSLAGEQQYLFLDGYGSVEELEPLGDVVAGKVVMVCRGGDVSFVAKAQNAAAMGAVGVIIYNNAPGVINMGLADYGYKTPCVSITQAEAAAIRAASTPVTDEDGTVLYHTGTMTVSSTIGAIQRSDPYYTMSSFSSWGVPGSLEMKPEITAPGGSIYSINGVDRSGKAYEVMSGTSMASPQMAGMAALVAQYIRENGLDKKTGLDARTLGQSLLMSTAVPMEEAEGQYYPILRQGSGLGNVGAAITADSYILMEETMNAGATDGKVKVELGDDPNREGVYEISFTLNNLTDVERSYALSADFFTQSYFQDYANSEQNPEQMSWYMDTTTTAMPVLLTWTVDGKVLAPEHTLSGLDFNGDNAVNTADGQALLDYATGAAGSLQNLSKADLDGDGDVDTHDAYLFFRYLNTSTLLLPAGGEAQITVRVELTEQWETYSQACQTKGLYIQGYLYAEGLIDAEGAAGTVHSIPVLGWYGNWTDPSMFDEGSYPEYVAGDNFRTSYMGSQNVNSFYVTYGAEPYVYYRFGGNPLIPDETYKEERNAINAELGDAISRVNFTAIRNVSASRYQVRNLTTNKTLGIGYAGGVTGAYYYVNGGYWLNSSYDLTATLPIAGVQENQVLEYALTLSPEYYYTGQDKNGYHQADWNALGEGATKSITMTVDNTFPVMERVMLDLINNTLVVKASDNQYVSAVVLYNSNGSHTFAKAGAKQDIQPGESAEYVLDLDGVYGEKFLLQVTDYAMNRTTYLLETQIGEPVDYTGKFVAFTTGSVYHGQGNRWVTLDPEELFFYYRKTDAKSFYGGINNVIGTDLTVTAAEYVDGYVYMAAKDGNLYVADMDDLSIYEKVCSLEGRNVVGMAMNYADGMLYIMSKVYGTSTTHYQMTISSIHPLNGDITDLYDVEVYNPVVSSKSYTQLSGLAIDDAGNFYSVNYGAGTMSFLYSWTNDMAADGKIQDLAPINNDSSGTTGFYGTYSSLAWDHDRDELYMAAIYSQMVSNNNILVKLDTGTGKGARVNSYDGGYGDANAAAQLQMPVAGLFIVPASGYDLPLTDEPSKVILDKTEIELLVGASFRMGAEVAPWCLNDKTVSWTTSDPTVATVDTLGKITAVGEGDVIITATTNAAPQISAQCRIHVSRLEDVKLSGLVYDPMGDTFWSEFVTDELPNWTPVSGKSEAYLGGTVLGDVIYAHDGARIYGIDPDTFETRDLGGIASSWIWSDAAPAPAVNGSLFGGILGLCYNGQYLELLDPEAGTLEYWNVSGYLAADPMATIAYLKSGTYNYLNKDYPAQYYFLMTESGKLYELVLYTRDNGTTYSQVLTLLGDTGLRLPGVATVGGGTYASMTYDEASGYLLLSAHTEAFDAKLYAIHPEVLVPAELGNFGENVWPVVSLYQYERATDLAVRLRPQSETIYEGEHIQFSAKVLLGSSDQVVWSSSDESIMTVDQNGLAVAVGEGTVTITATTVCTNEAGQTASSSAEIQVVGLLDVETQVNAQIQTPEGAKWVSFDSATASTTVLADAATTFTGGGYGGDGKLYGNNSNYVVDSKLVQADIGNGFSETAGFLCPVIFSILDMTNGVPTPFEAKDANGETITVTGLNAPFYVTSGRYVMFMWDYYGGTINGFNLSAYYNDLAAIAYIQPTTYGTSVAQMFLALGADGTLYQFIVVPSYASKTGKISHSMYRSEYGNIGKRFTSDKNLSMAYDGNGLIIADSSQGYADLFYVDLTAETLSCGKLGRISGATGISSLYTDSEVNGTNPTDTIKTASVDAQTCVEAAPITAAEVLADETVGTAWSNLAEGLVLPTTETVTEDAAEPNSEAAPAPTEDTVTITVTTPEAANNGLATVTWDTALLALDAATIAGNYTAKVEESGKLTFGYVSLTELPADGTIATLTFKVLKAVDSTVTVEHKQVNNEKGSTETLKVEFEHKNTEVRGKIEPTCTTAGYTGDTYCTDCGQRIAKGTIVEALGHIFGEWTVTKEATCTEKGEETRSCTACDATETREVAAHGHDCAKKEVAPTCTERGYTEYTCGTCGYTYRASFVDALGHSFGEWEILEPATCTEDGLKTRSCFCGETETEVIPACCPSAQYEDVAPDTWYHEAIDYMVGNGIMNGVSDTHFAPDGTANRAHLVTVLYRLAGSPSVEGLTNPFVDVPADQWYTDAVIWAYANKITTGVTDDLFAPDASVIREQVVTFLARYAEYTGVNTTTEGDLSSFSDADAVSAYAKDAMAWAVENGIIAGMDDGTLSPTATSNRAQIAVILMRYCTLTA